MASAALCRRRAYARSGGPLRAAHAPDRPYAEQRRQAEREREGSQDHRRLAGDEAASRLEQAGDRVERRDRADPALEEAEWHEDRRREENEEDRDLHQRSGLDRAKAH